MVIQIFQDITLVLFILSCLIVLRRHKKQVFGLIVKKKDKKILDGSQGVSTVIGRLSSSDVVINKPNIGRKQAVVSYNAKDDKIDIIEPGKKCLWDEEGYHVGGEVLNFFYPKNIYDHAYRGLPMMSATVFIILQAVSTYMKWNSWPAIGPHIILVVFLWAAFFTRVDHAPIVENILAIFLTFYIESTYYPALYPDIYHETFEHCIMSAYIGVILYCIVCMAARMAMRIDFSKYLGKHSLHEWLRWIASVIIVALVILNVQLGSEVNGAYNWIKIGGITFQPGEIVKVLYLFVMVVPDNRKFYDKSNIISMILVSMFVMAYPLLIRDSGLLLQLVVILISSILLQNSNILLIAIMIAGTLLGGRLVLQLSATAAYRFSSWLGNGDSVWKALTGSGSFMNFNSYGYQSVHSLVAAFMNGGLFGNQSFDVMKGLMAPNSDLVMALVAQSHGVIMLFMVLGLYYILLKAVFMNHRQQNRFQQILSCLAAMSVMVAMLLNIGGTFSIIPLTGVVSPAISDGISSAVCYGAMYGLMSASAISKAYYEKFS